MASARLDKEDHWTSKAYNDAAKFVPQLTSTVVRYLDPKPGDHILDLGCGDGVLTVQLAQTISPGKVVGLDASPSMIAAAQERCSSSGDRNCSFEVQDCTKISAEAKSRYFSGKFDRVFSNAALHWILRSPKTRSDVLRAAYDALKPGGVFVFEMGGHGNCGEVYGALVAALMAQGFSAKEATECSPWFFPSVDWIRSALEEVGFEIEKVETEYRPTKLTPKDGDGKGGLEGWTRLMGAQFLEVLDEQKRNEAIKMVMDILDPIITREEDGSQWLGYVRLRGVARKRT